MDNNLILKKIKYVQFWNDKDIIDAFQLGGIEMDEEQMQKHLKKEDDVDFVPLLDEALAGFLNGLIIKLRGPKGDEQPVAEKELNNNLILRKLKIAYNLKDTDMLELFELATFRIGKAELSAFFRKEDHKNFRWCKDQILRNFLMGLQLKLRKK